MPLKRSIVKGLSFGKSDRKPGNETTSTSKTTTTTTTTTTAPYFPPAPTKRPSLKFPQFLTGHQPTPHPLLQPHQIRTLTHLLSLPRHTPLLSTRIAALGPPLARARFTNPARGFCESHLWFEGRWIEEFSGVIGEEIGPRLGKLRRWKGGLLSLETREVLMTLEPYLHLFPAQGVEVKAGSEGEECHRDNCSICSLASCPACKLSLFLQNEDAVRAVRMGAFGRKKKREEWPEACAWLDPEPGSDWEARWRREGNEILRDRAHVQRADKNARLSAESGDCASSEYSRGSTGASSLALDESSHGKKSSAAEIVREEYLKDVETAGGEKTWAEDFPGEEYTKDVDGYCTSLTRRTSTRRESFANMVDTDSRYSRSTRGTSLSTAPLCRREDLNPRRLRSVRGMSAQNGAFTHNEAELTHSRSSKADYSTFLSKMVSGVERVEDVDSGDEKDAKVKAAAWARSYEQLTREQARSEWFLTLSAIS